MTIMISRARHLAILLPLVLTAVACVPTPVGRRSPIPVTAPPATTPTETATTPPVPTGPTQRPSFMRPTPTPLPTFFVYVVQAGDSLTSIARAFSTTGFSIAAWNRNAYPSLDPDSETYLPNRIKVGWILRLIPNLVIDEEDLLVPSPTAS